MKINKNFYIIILLFSVIFCSSSKKTKKIEQTQIDEIQLGEQVNSIYMVVGKKAITKIDMERMTKLVGFISKVENRKINSEDFLIEMLIIEQVAEQESIIVNENALITK